MGLVHDGKVLTSTVFEVGSNRELKPLLSKLENDVLRFARLKTVKIEGIGVAFPGIVDTDNSRVIDTSAKYIDGPSIDMVRWAREKFHLLLKIDNDARLACLGEWHYGSGKGTSDMIMLTIGTGIGSAVIMDGKLLRGKHFQAGILAGHTLIDYNNKTDRCSCGKYGCMEGIASMWMIEEKAKRSPLFKNSLLRQAGQKINWRLIIQLSEEGDELSRQLKQHCLEVWSVGLINLVHAYDPERVIIGGGVSHAENTILPYLRSALQKRSWCPGGPPEIKIADFPDTAALLGAAILFDTKR